MPTNIFLLPLVEIEFETGANEDWLDSVLYYEDDGVTPIDLTGISFRMQVRKRAEDATVYIDASTDNGLLSAGSNGVLGRIIFEDHMKAIKPGNYVFDVVAEADGHACRVEYGSLTIVEGVTR
jgi:hypothetical protein